MFNKTYSKWYAVFVITGEEDRVRERLLFRFRDQCEGLRVIVPKRRLRERKNGVWESKIRTLFPGYVLINGQLGVKEYYMMKGVPGLIRILKDKSDPVEIREEEIRIINRLIGNNEIIGASSVFMEGGRVVVVDGPLLGMDGLIESIDKRKGRAKVRLNFIGEDRLIELSVSMVQSA